MACTVRAMCYVLHDVFFSFGTTIDGTFDVILKNNWKYFKNTLCKR